MRHFALKLIWQTTGWTPRFDSAGRIYMWFR